jgi:uncharacterized protein (DUF362 family)
LVAGVAAAISSKGASQVIIAEGKTFGTGRYTFSMADIKSAVKGIKNVSFRYLDEEILEEIEIDNPYIPNHKVKYPKKLFLDEIDYFISLPKLKANNYAGITLSIKNSFGIIPKKERLKYHDDRLHKYLADLTLIRKPDLVITDAIISGEGNGPGETDPVETNMIIVGKNPLAVDATCCYLMGQKAEDIEHLQLLHERGFGPLSIQNIEISNKEYLDEKKRNFKMPDLNLKVHPSMKIFTGDRVCRPGCQAFLRTYLDSYGRNVGWDVLKDFAIIVGENVKVPQNELKSLQKKKTIIFGSCAEEYKKYGAYFKGCTPDYAKGFFKLGLATDLPTNPYFDDFPYGKFLWHWFIHILTNTYKQFKHRLRKLFKRKRD